MQSSHRFCSPLAVRPSGIRSNRWGQNHADFSRQTTFYQQLKKLGIASTIFQHREYTPSSFGDVIFSGAKATGYKTLPEALVNLAEALAKPSPTKEYYVLYYEKIDSVSHEYGPDSPQTNAEIQVFLMTMETIFLNALKGNRRKILFLLSADHGQSETDPQTTVYLTASRVSRASKNSCRTNQQGTLIVPGGSARDFFLYIRPGMVEEAQAFLTPRLEGKAEVRKVADLALRGLFWSACCRPNFLGGQVTWSSCHTEVRSVWWYEKNKYEQRYYGHHGGLTPQEMEIPLITWEM